MHLRHYLWVRVCTSVLYELVNLHRCVFSGFNVLVLPNGSHMAAHVLSDLIPPDASGMCTLLNRYERVLMVAPAVYFPVAVLPVTKEYATGNAGNAGSRALSDMVPPESSGV